LAKLHQIKPGAFFGTHCRNGSVERLLDIMTGGHGIVAALMMRDSTATGQSKSKQQLGADLQGG